MNTTKFEVIYQKVIKFNEDRGWKPAPQDIAKSVVLEAAELLEHFQWDGGKNDGIKGKDIKEIKYEVADVLWYLIHFCHETGIDIVEAMEMKMIHNEEKYPKEMFAGKHNHDFYMAQKKKYRAQKAK